MEAAVFILSLIDCCILIFLSVYFIITLSDLECDYINARACCSKLNKWVVPELVGQALATVLMLISMHWFVFLLNLPVAAWNVYRFLNVPMGNMGVFDPTEIHNRGQLKSHMKEAMIKLGFHLLCFFIYLYSSDSFSFRDLLSFSVTALGPTLVLVHGLLFFKNEDHAVKWLKREHNSVVHGMILALIND